MKCHVCKGAACDEGCRKCDNTPSNSGPNAHRQCRHCHGSGDEPMTIDRAINIYLDNLHSSTWGRPFHILPKGENRNECVEFIRELVESINKGME